MKKTGSLSVLPCGLGIVILDVDFAGFDGSVNWSGVVVADDRY